MWLKYWQVKLLIRFRDARNARKSEYNDRRDGMRLWRRVCSIMSSDSRRGKSDELEFKRDTIELVEVRPQAEVVAKHRVVKTSIHSHESNSTVS